MVELVAPFVKLQRSIVIDTSLNRFPTKPQVVGKLREYHTFPAFDIPNVWRGASEILLRFDFDAGLVSLLNAFPLTPPAGANFVPVLSWLKDEVYYRYKLWYDVGEILWLPVYNKQKITADTFYIEIWNTNTTIGLGTEDGGGLGLEGLGSLLGIEQLTNLILNAEIKVYGSRLNIPTAPYCDLGDLNLGSPTQCVDPVFNLTNFEPLYGDYYLLVSPCSRQLIKGKKEKPTYNLLKNRDDNTWHEVWIYISFDGTVALDVNPDNVVPPLDALGYFPMIVAGHPNKIIKFELTGGSDSGNYFVSDSVVEASESDLNVVLLQDGANRDDAHLYGFYLIQKPDGTYTFEVIQNIISI